LSTIYQNTGTQEILDMDTSVATNLTDPVAMTGFINTRVQMYLPPFGITLTGATAGTGPDRYIIPMDGTYVINSTLDSSGTSSAVPYEVLYQFTQITSSSTVAFAECRIPNFMDGTTFDRISLNGVTHCRAGDIIQARTVMYENQPVPNTILVVAPNSVLSVAMVSNAPKPSVTRIQTAPNVVGNNVTNVPLSFPTLLYTSNTAFAAPVGEVWTFPERGWYMIQADLSISFSSTFPTSGAQNEVIMIWFEQITPTNRIIGARYFAFGMNTGDSTSAGSFFPQINFTASAAFAAGATGRLLYSNNSTSPAPVPTIIGHTDARPNRISLTLIERTNLGP
jgi:hypothetical protein